MHASSNLFPLICKEITYMKHVIVDLPQLYLNFISTFPSDTMDTREWNLMANI